MASMADQLNQYLKSKGSPLAGYGASFVQAGSKYGIDPRFLVAISGAETSFGKAGGGPSVHNAWGLGPGMKFPSWEKGIDYAAYNLTTGPYRGADTAGAIHRVWAPVGASNDPSGLNGQWGRNVSTFMQQLGLSPTASIRIRKGATLASSPVTSSSPEVSVQSSSPATRQDETVRLDKESLARLMKWVDDSTRDAKAGRILELPAGTLEAVAAARARALGAKAANEQAGASGATAVPEESAATVASSPTGFQGELLGHAIDRAGAPTGQGILSFARQVSAAYGKPITLGTGTQHNKMTTSGNVSAHWAGNALDLPATGNPLIQMGRAALRAAGYKDWATAPGGLYNVGGKQIIFGVNWGARSGGDHTNHLHIGLRK